MTAKIDAKYIFKRAKEKKEGDMNANSSDLTSRNFEEG